MATSDLTIVAGALSGKGASENIADYSQKAGALAVRFLLASGETGYPQLNGTSFAAPRIAGAAAIIKQKYPSLTGKQIADVLLLSASKDINNDGIPDFSGISSIYGHGKLDLNAALSLVHSLVSQSRGLVISAVCHSVRHLVTFPAHMTVEYKFTRRSSNPARITFGQGFRWPKKRPFGCRHSGIESPHFPLDSRCSAHPAVRPFD
ncbi:MAG: S8 family serine peptidase [Rhodoferax sp.]|nr:S8 family serine peptidase [Rhodoferax sp.]